MAAALLLASCGQKAPPGVDERALTENIGRAIGDPNTCVVLVERGKGQVWQLGSNMTCSRNRPSCEGSGQLSVKELGKSAATGAEVAVSCPTPDGLTAWSAGPVGGPDGKYAYAAGMVGERALPGMEIGRRLNGAFERAGL